MAGVFDCTFGNSGKKRSFYKHLFYLFFLKKKIYKCLSGGRLLYPSTRHTIGKAQATSEYCRHNIDGCGQR